jgi:hypothetical protein
MGFCLLGHDLKVSAHQLDPTDEPIHLADGPRQTMSIHTGVLTALVLLTLAHCAPSYNLLETVEGDAGGSACGRTAACGASSAGGLTGSGGNAGSAGPAVPVGGHSAGGTAAVISGAGGEDVAGEDDIDGNGGAGGAAIQIGSGGASLGGAPATDALAGAAP